MHDLPGKHNPILDTLNGILRGRLLEENDLILVTDNGIISGTPVLIKDDKRKTHLYAAAPIKFNEAYDIYGKIHPQSSPALNINGYIIMKNAQHRQLSDHVLEAEYMIVYLDQIRNMTVGKFY